MRVALVHDYIKEYGGAERVLETLHEMYPDADVYTSVYLPEYLGPHRKRFEKWKIHTSFLQYIPFKQKLISPFRLLSPLAFQTFDFLKYDVVIVSATGAYFPNSIRTTPHPLPKREGMKRGENHSPLAISHKPVHICYCHTPPRYLYGYATAREWKKHVVFKILGEIANHFLRIIDFNASKNVDYYIANSEEVKRRIEKFYRREAIVIYPPVDLNSKSEARNLKQAQNTNDKKQKRFEHLKFGHTNLFRNSNFEIRDYFLAGGRLARPKHIDLIIKACRELDIPLKVFGKGFAGYGEELRKLVESSPMRHSGDPATAGGSRIDPGQVRMTSSNIEFLGEVSDEEKWELMRKAKAYINASEDEDFGILPVEAMAAGTPVIAYRSGGVKETVVEGNPSAGSGQGTGIFFDELTVESLEKAIKRFNDLNHFSKEACKRQAEKFAKERFEKEVRAFVHSTFKTMNPLIPQKGLKAP